MKQPNIMTVEHPVWKDFVRLLGEILGLDGCDGATLSHARSVLKQFYPQVDLDASLKYFQNNGGFCDCEIFLNIDPDCKVFKEPSLDLGGTNGPTIEEPEEWCREARQKLMSDIKDNR